MCLQVEYEGVADKVSSGAIIVATFQELHTFLRWAAVLRRPPSFRVVCFSGAARPVGLGGRGGVVLRGLSFRSIHYASSLVWAAASSLLFGGLGGARGLDGLRGVAFRGVGACGSRGWRA